MAENYQQKKQKLSDILEKLQDSEIDIDEALKLHDQAKKLVKDLEEYLGVVEEKIKSKTED